MVTTEDMPLGEKLRESACLLKVRFGKRKPTVGIILGSGLGELAYSLKDCVDVPFEFVPHMKSSTAPSHRGRFVCGTLSGVCVLLMQGRLHGYEGYSSAEVAYPVWLMKKMGIETLITTNAVGAINETFNVGDFCLITDHINFTGRNPIVGQEPNELAPRFFSLFDAYDPRLRELAKKSAQEASVFLHEGVYLGLLGPSFETPAEIRAFRSWGADTVAMSLCEEVIAARHVGISVLGISLISNKACGVDGLSPNDSEVLDVARKSLRAFVSLMCGIVKNC